MTEKLAARRNRARSESRITEPNRGMVSNSLSRNLRPEGEKRRRHQAPIIITNTTAKLTCSDWVRWQSLNYVEMVQPHGGFSGEAAMEFGTVEGAMEFAARVAPGFTRLGVTRTNKVSEGLTFTGLDAQADRTDPDVTSREQPKFKRGLFDNE